MKLFTQLRHSAATLALTAIIASSFAPVTAVNKASAQEARSKARVASSKEKAPVGAADYGLAQVREINTQIASVWTDNGLTPSPAATDNEWCRRVFLDVLGRVPTVPEIQAFTADKSADKKLKLVEKLLNDEEYNGEYARNWTTIWTNILIGRNGGMEDDTLISRAGMQKYLRDSFARNKPYDRMVYELVTATGGTSPGAENFNGATNFLIMKLDEGAAQATAMTAKHFLGLQVQCTQCHNHPFNDWKQQKFWDLNAFFKQTRALRRFAPGTNDITSAELVNQDYAGDTGDPSEAAVSYELRSGLLKVSFPVFIDGTEISKSGYVLESDRRTKLGELMLQSEYLDKTIANRMWAHFMGYGFTKPIDDMGPHNVPSHPQLLDYLGKEVRKNSFNLKELMKWIVLSEAYSLSSKVTPGNQADDPLLGESPKFTHFYLRQMRAEELYESLVVATQADKTKGSYEEQEKLKAEWMKQFVIAFGTDEGDETTTFNGTIPQILMMFNGDLVKKATSPEQGSFVHQLATDTSIKPLDKVNYLFMAGLGRPPSQNEVVAAQQLAATHKGNSIAAMEDLWWAVLNSNEFIMNH